MKVIDLFSGIGGFALAARNIGWETICFCENDPFCQKVLSYHFPGVYIHDDVKTLPYDLIKSKINNEPTIIVGGWPCQPFSLAGKREGTNDDRYLWKYYLRAIDECNPDWVTGENVTGILSMEDKSGIYRDVFAKVENRKITRFHEVDYYEAVYTRQAKMLVNSICESLEERGYEVQTFAIPAASVEAPHRRERIWFVAHRSNAGTKGVRRERENSIYGCEVIANGTSELQQGNESGKCSTKRRQILQQENRQANTEFAGATCKNGHAPHAISDDAGRYGHGEIGQAARKGKVVGEKRQRFRTVIERIGAHEYVANPNTICEQANESQERQKESRTRGQFKGSIKRNDAHTSGTGRKELNLSDFAAKSENGDWRSDKEHRRGFRNFPTQSPVCGRNDELSSRLDGITFSSWRNESIKAFGNSLVWNIPFEIFKVIDTITW